MTRPAATTVLTLCAVLLVACRLFDSGIEWRNGRFALLWIDVPDEVRLSYDEGNGGWSEIIPAQVFAVGSDDRFIVAQQHPGGDRAVTNYFVLDTRQYDSSHRAGLIGPLNTAQFERKASELKLPPFTTVLESLR
jgi:hypothetical protein